MSNENIKSIVEAKRNEIESKNLDSYYGDDSFEARRAIAAAYPFYESDETKLARYLEATKVPKYVRLAKHLNRIGIHTNVPLAEARVLLSKSSNEYSNVKTIYKEFKQIKARSRKTTRKAIRAYKKYKDVKKFVDKDLRDVLKGAQAICASGFSNDPMAHINELTRYFDRCDSLYFLNRSSLTKKVR